MTRRDGAGQQGGICRNLPTRAPFRRGISLGAAVAAVVVLLAAVCAAGSAARAQGADAILVNGKILTADAKNSTAEALAIRDGKILALGTSAEMRRLAGPATRVIDLQRRTAIPGLTDGHMHAIRAGLSYSQEVSWIGATSLEEALGRIREAARTAPAGAWIYVGGGWIDLQFKERRRPTQAEVMAAAPNRPVYIQHLYEWVLLTPPAMAQLGIAKDADVPPRGKVVRDVNGAPTGEIVGDGVTVMSIFNKLPKPSFAQQLDGTRTFFRELNRLGLTGVIDPAGTSVFPSTYDAVFKLWQERQLTLRVAYTLSSQKRGKELEDYQDLTQLLPMGFGDSMLHFNGIGEIVTWGAWTDGDPTEDAMAALHAVAKWAVGRGLGLQIHWNKDRTVPLLLTMLERVNAETPIAGLRWTVLHLYDATPKSLERMKRLGVGWGVQDGLYYGGERFQREAGEAAARALPPIKTALAMGVMVGGGTDAHRVSPYNPFVSLRWYLDGKTVAGTQTRGMEEAPTRAQALRMYTWNTAWFAHEETVRGSLEPGKLADLAVLSKDYMTVPVEEIGGIESLLTMVGGKIVYAAGPYADLEDKAR